MTRSSRHEAKVEVVPLFAEHSFLCPRQAHDEPLVLRSFRPHAPLLLKMSHARSEHWQTHAGHLDVLSVASRCHFLASESACVLVVRLRGLLDIRTGCKRSCLDTRFQVVCSLTSISLFARAAQHLTRPAATQTPTTNHPTPLFPRTRRSPGGLS